MPHRTAPLRRILGRSEGYALCSPAEAVLKGCLEAESPVELVTGPPTALFSAVLRIAELDPIAELLRRHRTRVRSSVDATRGVMLAIGAAMSGRRAVAIVPHEELHLAMPHIAAARARGLPSGGAASFLVDDDPVRHAWPAPRRLLASAGLGVVEPMNLSELRHSLETTLVLSKSALQPTAAVLHSSLLRSLDTIECFPNRELEAVEVDAMLRRRRRRRVRCAEGEGLLRVARRLELNRLINLPSPGERVEFGFITIGPPALALRHVLYELELLGRIPLLELGLVNPLDDAALGRFLERCERAIILESRPGAAESDVLAIAEEMRRQDRRPASIWGRHIPGQPDSRFGPDEAGSPSLLARRLIHLLHQVRPGRQVAARLVLDGAVEVPAQAAERDVRPPDPAAQIHDLLRGVADWLAVRAPLEERGLEPSTLMIEGAGREAPRSIRAEIFGGGDLRVGPVLPAAVAQMLQDDQNWLAVMCCEDVQQATVMERLISASAPPERADRLRIHREQLDEPLRLRNALREACLHDGVSCVVVACGDPIALAATPATRRAVEAIGEAAVETLQDIDRQGFQRREIVIQSADEPCNLRASSAHTEPIISRLGHAVTGGVTFNIDEVPQRVGAMWRLRLRPLVEQVEVVRSRPPLLALRALRGGRLALPEPVHAGQPVWRAHFAGVRGELPGIAVAALCEAGRHQGYHVRCLFDPASDGGGRSFWSQVLFSRLPEQGAEPLPLTGAIPFGEADLLVGANLTLAAHAVVAGGGLRVAHPVRTFAALDSGPQEPARSQQRERLDAIAQSTREADRVLLDIASITRAMFGTDRPTDLVLLGVCFQRGWIPLTLDSMEAGLAIMEDRDHARCRDAFQLGRHLAVEDPSLRRGRRQGEASIDRLIRRAALSMRQESRGLRRRAADFRRLTGEALDAMPGLGESEAGRVAQREFIAAMERLVRWGGISYARQYRDLVMGLYAIDRGDSGRALTRHSVLSLAEAMLIRDAAYVAAMAMSLAARRVIRQKLNAKPSRGDALSRRFLNRFEAVGARRRLRVDFRTSDWTAALTARILSVWPNRLRGSSVDRERRDEMLRLVRRAIEEAPVNYAEWDRSLKAFHDLAAGGQLRHLSANALRLLAPDPLAQSAAAVPGALTASP